MILSLPSISTFSGDIDGLVWLPLLVFELALAFWFIARGVTAPAPRLSE